MITSCIHCRRSKKRCSRTKPSCARCIEYQLECDYTPTKLIYSGQERIQFDKQRIKHLSKKLDNLMQMAEKLNLIKSDSDSSMPTTPDGNLSELNIMRLTPAINFCESNILINYERKTEEFYKASEKLNQLYKLDNKDKRNTENQKQIKILEYQYLKSGIQSINELLILNNITKYQFKHQLCLNQTSFRNNIVQLFIDLHLEFYPFISKDTLFEELAKLDDNQNSPLFSAVALKVLRHSKYVNLRDLGCIQFNKNQNNIKVMNHPTMTLPLLMDDPLYIQCCELIKNDNSSKFKEQLSFIQANILLVSIEFVNLLQSQAYDRMMKVCKLSQILLLHDIENSIYYQHNQLSKQQLYEIKSTFAIILMHDFLTSCFQNKPSIYKIADKDALIFQSILIKLDKDEDGINHTKLMGCLQIAQTISILHMCNRLSFKYTNQELSLQKYEQYIIDNINKLDQIFTNHNESTVNNLLNVIDLNQYPCANLDYISLLIKHTLIIDLVEPLIDAFAIAQIQTEQVYQYQLRCLKSAKVIIKLMDYRTIENTINSKHPFWTIRESIDWIIPLAAFHSLKAIIKCRNLNLISEDLGYLTLPLRQLYIREAPQYPLCSSKLDFERYQAWELEFQRDKLFKIHPNSINSRGMCNK